MVCRTLGNFAGILSERKNIHHSISSSLDSNDLVELEAAIAAAKQYAAQSKYVKCTTQSTTEILLRSVHT